MSARELTDWLETEESKSAGWHHEGEDASIGHQSGRQIIAILRSRRSLPEDDRAHMRKAAAPTIKRHLAQRPNHHSSIRAGATRS